MLLWQVMKFFKNCPIDQMIAKMQKGLFLFLLILFPVEPSHFKWHIRALSLLMNIKLSFFLSDLIILAIFFLFFFRSKKEWQSSFWSGPPKWLFLFYAMGVVSLILSDFAFAPAHYFRLLVFLTKILLVSSLVFLAKEGGKKFLREIFYVIGAFALIEALVALFCYYTQSYLDVKHFHLIPFSEMTAPCCVDIPHGFRWIGDRLFGMERAPESILRSYGTFNHPNILGGYFVFTLLVSYFLFFYAKNGWIRRSVACSIFLQVLALCSTFSRAALFSWIGATTLFFLFFYFQGKEKFSSHRKSAFCLMWMIVFSLLVSFVFLGEQFFHRGGVFQYNELARNSDRIRWSAQDRAFMLIKKHPFFGVGLENFRKDSSISGTESGPMLHNCYLLIAAEMGLIALLFFCGFLLSLCYGIKKRDLSLEALVLLSVFAGLMAIGLCDFYPLFLQGGMIPFFISSALFTAVLRKEKESVFADKKELFLEGS